MLGGGVSAMNSIVLKKYNTQQLQALANMPGGMGSSALAELEKRKTISRFDEPQATAQAEPAGMMAPTSNAGRTGSIRNRLDSIEERLSNMESGSEDVTEPSPTPPPPAQVGGIAEIANAMGARDEVKGNDAVPMATQKASQDMFGSEFLRKSAFQI